MVRGLNTTVSYSMDSFVVQQFEDLFDRGKAGGLHSYKTRSEFVEACLKQFVEKFDEKLNIKIDIPTPDLRKPCPKCNTPVLPNMKYCPNCDTQVSP